MPAPVRLRGPTHPAPVSYTPQDEAACRAVESETRTPPQLEAMSRHRAALLLAMQAGSDHDRAVSRVLAEGGRPGDATRDALAAEALRTRDAGVYRLALSMCSGTADSAHCARLSPLQWARMDPHNAQPWLYVAARAREAGDEALVAEALHRAAQSRRSDTGWGRISASVLAHADLRSGDGLVAASTLAMEAFSVEGAWTLTPYQGLLVQCTSDRLHDANQRQTCATLADVLADRSDTLLELMMGISLGKRLGWPAERIDALLRERDAVTQAGQREIAHAAEAASPCERLRRGMNHIGEIAQHGELGMARRSAKR